MERLLAEAETAPPGCDGLLFLPYLDGERSPIWDAAARAAFLGVNSQHSRPHFLRAVLEGVAFSMNQIIGIARTQTGIEPSAFMVSGGGAKSALWSQIRADVSQLPVNVCKETETGALGAAILAAVAAGLYDDLAQAAAKMVSVERTVGPNAGHRTLYAESQARYEAAYPAIREVSRMPGP
jgi:xylulokinase